MPNRGISFAFSGSYRVQSRLAAEPSSLSGRWAEARPDVLTDAEVDAELKSSQRWSGRASVALAPAVVERRSGSFAREADALYYRHFFQPAPGTAGMDSHVLDVTKLMDLWERRLPLLAEAFTEESLEQLLHLVGDDPWPAAINEYVCHEGGHASGLDVDTKFSGGYFRLGSVGGGPSWPLIFTEEFRADLLSFFYAQRLLPPQASAAVFAYHILHRFGLAAEATQLGNLSSGAVPYLLFHLLRSLGVVSVSALGRLELTAARADPVAAMDRCVQHVDESWTDLPSTAPDWVDVARRAALYFRARASDDAAMAAYESVFPNSIAAGSR